jgi:hypothetical protein
MLALAAARMTTLQLLEVLKHVPNPLGFLRSIQEDLKDHGLLILSTPNRLSLKSIAHLTKYVIQGRVYHAGDPTHLWLFSPWQARRLLQKAGLKVLHSVGYHFGCGDERGGKIPSNSLVFRQTHLLKLLSRVLVGIQSDPTNSKRTCPIETGFLAGIFCPLLTSLQFMAY